MPDTPGPAGSDLDGYFAAARPVSPPPIPAPASQPPAAAPVPGPPVNQFGTPVNQFGTPVNQLPPPVPGAAMGWQPPYPVPPVKAPRRTFLIVGGSVAAVVVLVGAAVGVYLHNRHSLSLPSTLNGQPQMTDQGSDIFRRGLVDELKSAGAHDAVVGFYGVPGQPYALVIAAGGPNHGDVDAELSSVESGMTQSATLTGMTDVDTGKFQGRMECGSFLVQTRNIPVCVWADGTVGVEALYTTPPSDAPSTALQIREAIEH